MLLATLLLLASPHPVHALGSAPVVVRGSRARPAIERILKADNMRVDLLSPAEVAARMEEIEQGAAPDDFWTAYLAHVRAWRAYATAIARSRRADPRDPDKRASLAVAEARVAINRSFDVVEEQARKHNARIPSRSTAR